MKKNQTIILNEGVIDYPTGFKELYHILASINYLSKEKVPLVIEQIHKNPFFIAINQPKTRFAHSSTFYNTKESMIQKNLVTPHVIPSAARDLLAQAHSLT